jgi:hypothetical protein
MSTALSRNGTRQPQAKNAPPVTDAQLDHQECQAGHGERDGPAEPGEHGVASPAPVGRVLGGEQRGPCPFSDDGEALAGAQDHEHDRGGDADRGSAGQQPDRDGAQAHQHECDDQSALAAEPVAVVAEQDRGDRPDERDGEGGEGGQLPTTASRCGKNTLSKTRAAAVPETK